MTKSVYGTCWTPYARWYLSRGSKLATTRDHRLPQPEPGESHESTWFRERLGVGIASAKKTLVDNGNPGLRFEVDDDFMLATIKGKSK